MNGNKRIVHLVVVSTVLSYQGINLSFLDGWEGEYFWTQVWQVPVPVSICWSRGKCLFRIWLKLDYSKIVEYKDLKQCCGSKPGSVSFFRIRIRFPGCLGSGSGSISYSHEHNKLTGRENWTKNTFCVGPVGPNDKENEVKMYKKYCFKYITSLKQSDPDPYQIGKQDPNPY